MLQIPEFKKELYICAKCGYCRESCPTRRLIGFDRICPRGLIVSMKHFLEKQKPISKELTENWYFCTTCGRCKEVCPADIDLPELIRSIRIDMIQKGLQMPAYFTTAVNGILDDGNPIGKVKEEKTDLLSGSLITPKKSKYLYFAGCMASYWLPETANAISEILKLASFDFGTLGLDESCCGLVPAWSGDMESTKQVVKKIMKSIEESGASTVFTSCPGCYTTFKNDYPKISGNPGFEVLHVLEVFKELINRGDLTFRKKIDSTVTYHDPCHIGRFHGMFETPREIIQAIPGVRLVEMEYNRKEANCCGGPLRTGGWIDQALTIGKWRIEEAKEVGADLLVTCCPQCVINLRQAALGSIEVIDFPILLARALNLKLDY
ncbi:MAG: (Fe-S)-binding protein [Promethearchaeota archaeon]